MAVKVCISDMRYRNNRFEGSRVVSDLRELAELTSDAGGAQRVCWTPGWARARAWLREKLGALEVGVRVDAAGNLWATRPGRSRRCLVIGGHLDSVPCGGWLDGSLNVLAGLEVLRGLEFEEPALSVRLVDWADEEGGRFVHSLFGSSAACGRLDPAALRDVCDRDGNAMADVLRRYGVQLEHASEASRELADAAAYLELHIEQGPILEREGLSVGVVDSVLAVAEHRLTFAAGTTIADCLHAACRFVLGVRLAAFEHGALTTVGSLRTVEAPAGAHAGVELLIDQRDRDDFGLCSLVARTLELACAVADEAGVEVDAEPIWRSSAVPFDSELVSLAERAVLDVSGRCLRLASGALHDAAMVAASGIPSAMIFVRSIGGLSHCPQEDSSEEDLVLAANCLDQAVRAALGHLGA